MDELVGGLSAKEQTKVVEALKLLTEKAREVDR
jgi:hypothetical protein